MVEGAFFYDAVFYVGLTLLLMVVLWLSWQSTFVRGQQNLTLVVWQNRDVAHAQQPVSGTYTFTNTTSFNANIVNPSNGAHEDIDAMSSSNENLDTSDGSSNLVSSVEVNVSSDNMTSTVELSANESMLASDVTEDSPSTSDMSEGVLSMSTSEASDEVNVETSVENVATGINERMQAAGASEKEVSEEGNNLLNVNTNPLYTSNDNIRSPSSPVPENHELPNNERHEKNEDGTSNTDERQPSVASINLKASISATPNSETMKSTPTFKTDETQDELATSDAEREHTTTEGVIRIRLKFIDDNTRIVEGQLTQKVLNFKQRHFKTEMSEHRVVRLIFNGRLLKQDDSTLSQYGLYDNCVVHCHVSQPKPAPTPPRVRPTPRPSSSIRSAAAWVRRSVWSTPGNNNTQQNTLDTADVENEDEGFMEGMDISNFIGVLLWVIVALLWFIRFKHSYMFSTFSTFMLIFLTMLLVVPHYIFSVDLHFSVIFDTSNLRNFGVDRIVFLQRIFPNSEDQTAGAEDPGDGTSANPSSESNSGRNNESVAAPSSNEGNSAFDVNPAAPLSNSGCQGSLATSGGAAPSSPVQESTVPLSTNSEGTQGVRRRH